MGLATCAHVRPQVSGQRPGHTECYSAVATLLASLATGGVEKQATRVVCMLNLTADQKGSAARGKKSPDHPAGQVDGIKANRPVVIGQSEGGKGVYCGERRSKMERGGCWAPAKRVDGTVWTWRRCHCVWSSQIEGPPPESSVDEHQRSISLRIYIYNKLANLGRCNR